TVFDDYDLAAGDQPVVDVDVDRLADLAVELDDRAAAELEQLADLHGRLAEHRGDLDGDVVDRLQLLGVARRGRAILLQIFLGQGGVHFFKVGEVEVLGTGHGLPPQERCCAGRSSGSPGAMASSAAAARV